MILRRLATSIRKQDWFAVVIETLIVVMGVFLGLQVNNWNEARHTSAREAEMLNALQIEFEQNIETLRATLSSLEQRNASEHEAAKLMYADVITPEDREVLVRGLKEIMYFSPLSVRDNTFQSLKQSGDLSLISDREILIELNDFARQLAWVQAQRDSFRDGMSGMETEWREYVFHRVEDQPNRTYVAMDDDAFLADPTAVSAFHQVVRMKHIFTNYLPPLIEDAERTCRILANATRRPCTVAEEASS